MFEGVEAVVRIGKLIGQTGKCAIGPGGQTRCRNAEREGETAALPNDLLHRFRLATDSAGVRDADEQCSGVGVVEPGQLQMTRTVERGHDLAAGDDDRACWPGGVERPDLADVERVIEDNQQITCRGQRAVAGGGLVQGGRYGRAAKPE